MKARHRNFVLFGWGVLAWNVLVVLWGAFVRATGSGAGCGSHWPLCDGMVVPRDPGAATVIEFTHRVTSGLALLSLAALLVMAFRIFPRGHRVRSAAVLAGVFMLLEAALGAGLVLFGLVGDNPSPWRAVYLCAHLVNTMLLLATLAAIPWLASGGQRKRLIERPSALFATLPLALLMTITGGIAALGDTLYPGAAALAADSPVLLRLRLLHPLTAVLVGAFAFIAAWRVVRIPHLARAALAVLMLTGVQMAAGAVNVVLLAPVWMQILHLFLADLLWIALVVLYLEASHEPAR